MFLKSFKNCATFILICSLAEQFNLIHFKMFLRFVFRFLRLSCFKDLYQFKLTPEAVTECQSEDDGLRVQWPTASSRFERCRDECM